MYCEWYFFFMLMLIFFFISNVSENLTLIQTRPYNENFQKRVYLLHGTIPDIDGVYLC